jgi:hypothetical protein
MSLALVAGGLAIAGAPPPPPAEQPNLGPLGSAGEDVLTLLLQMERETGTLSPDDAYVVAHLLCCQEKYREALERVNAILRSDPQNRVARRLRACCHHGLEHREPAQTELEELIRQDPKDCLARQCLAEVLLRTCHMDEVRYIVDHIISLQPDFARAYLSLVVVAARTDDRPKVKASLVDYLKHSIPRPLDFPQEAWALAVLRNALLTERPDDWKSLVGPGTPIPVDVPPSVDEARKRGARIVSLATHYVGGTPSVRATLATSLLRFLDSPDPEVRAVAVKALPGAIGLLLHLDQCLPYLHPGRPIEERMALLARCATELDAAWREPAGDTSSKVKALLSELVNADATPPLFHELAFHLSLHQVRWAHSSGESGIPIRQVVRDGNERIVAARFLHAIPKAMEGCYDEGTAQCKRSCILAAVLGLGADKVSQVLVEWYAAEPDARARAGLVDPYLRWPKDGSWRASREQLLQLAAKDWDKDIAARAAALLKP